ncbi:hypothetical protein VPH35_085734 [Triticum aestivum]
MYIYTETRPLRCILMSPKTREHLHDRRVPLRKYPYARRRQDSFGIPQVPRRTENNYRRRAFFQVPLPPSQEQSGKSEEPKYHDTDDMNIYGMCTTTRCDAKFDEDRVPLPLLEHERLLPLRLVNVYFLYLAPIENRPVCTLRRYNPRRPFENECLRCLRCSCLHHVQFVTRFLVANSWDTRYPGAPHHLLHATAQFSFASVSQSSYRNRNAAVAPFSLSLPWHPFPFRHDDKCFIIMLLSTFQNCIKLVHVIRIMITTIKCFKIVVAINY